MFPSRRILKDNVQPAEPVAPAYVPPTPAPAPATTPSYDPRTPAEPEVRRPGFMMNSQKNALSSDVEIKGSLKFSNDLIIDGRIEGEVTSDGSLTVGENARIKGEIRTKSCVVFGKVEGNITVSDRCELKNSAELVGDVKAKTLAIEEGAQFMGKSIVGAAATKAPGAGGAPAPAGQQPGKPESQSVQLR